MLTTSDSKERVRLYSLFSSLSKSLPSQIWGDSGKRKIEWLST